MAAMSAVVTHRAVYAELRLEFHCQVGVVAGCLILLERFLKY